MQISAGTLLAKTPREVSGTQDITGGLPRVTEIFEARKPKEPAVIAEIDGTVELLGEKRRGKRTIIVRSESGIEREHLVSHGKHLRVHAGDFVRAGEALVDGPLVPHDILRISGEEAVQQYLTREIQNVYRSQRVDIDDKHIEIIVAQMLAQGADRKRRATPALLPGSVMDQFEFRAANQNLHKCVKIIEKGDSDFAEGTIVPKDALEQVNAQIEALGGEPAKGARAQAGHGQHAVAGHHQGGGAKLQLHLGRQLPGNHQGAHRGGPGRQGRQPGGSEGERDPWATWCRPAPDSTCSRIRKSAFARRPSKRLAAEKDRVLARSFPLLDGVEEDTAAANGGGTSGGQSTPFGAPATPGSPAGRRRRRVPRTE